MNTVSVNIGSQCINGINVHSCWNFKNALLSKVDLISFADNLAPKDIANKETYMQDLKLHGYI